MKTTIKALGVITGLLWLAVLLACVIGLVRTDSMERAFSAFAPYLGQAFDAEKWRAHWIARALCILICSVIGCVGSFKLLRGAVSGFLYGAIATLTWFSMVTMTRLLHMAPYRFERVGFANSLQLLGISAIFIVLFFSFRDRLAARSRAQ